MKYIIVSWLKNRYSWFVSRLSKKFQNSSLTKQVCYLMSFPNNDHGLIEELSKTYPVKVLYTKQCKDEAELLSSTNVSIYCIDSLGGLIESIKLVTRSKVIVADNYFAFLGDCHFSTNQVVAQLWHATGAIKQFGLEDKQTNKRTTSDRMRFKRVYDSFNYVFVASEKMGDVFKRSYGFKENQILYTGFPRTDHLVNAGDCQHETKKKTVLYLPTYRDTQELTNWLLDIDKVSNELGDEGTLQVKLHPHVTIDKQSTKNVQWVNSMISADDLMKQADVLITDYSSTAFDFTLISQDKQLIIYWPDEVEYARLTGIQQNIEHDFPNKIARSTDEVIEQLRTNAPPSNDLFNQKWNTYNDGQATCRVIDNIKQWMEKNED